MNLNQLSEEIATYELGELLLLKAEIDSIIANKMRIFEKNDIQIDSNKLWGLYE